MPHRRPSRPPDAPALDDRPGRFNAGPRLLIAVTVLAIAVGTILLHVREGGHPSYLFFFYLPVAVVSVVLGRIVGLCMAALAIVAVLLPTAWLGLDSLQATGGPSGENVAILAVWAVFLVAMAFLVGWVSERGGSLSLAQGLGGQAVRAIEIERRRTGQDIHDGIAQYAAAAYIETQVIADMTIDDPAVNAQAERLKQVLDSLVTEAREMVGQLRPPALGPAEFTASFSNLVDGFRNRTGIPVELEVEGDFGPYTDSMRACVYRTTQEALANVERHAAATKVRIWTKAGKGAVDLIVRDNGKGFDPKLPPPVDALHHFGLPGMRERAHYLGGRVRVESAPGAGTSVILHIPRYQGGKDVWV